MEEVFLPQVTNGYCRFTRHFSGKMSELMVALEFVKTYLDDLLCITRASLDNHLEKQREVLTRLREAGLKANAQKSKFCTKETEYLGYVLTTDGIKPQQKKTSDPCTNPANWSQRNPA